MRFYNYSVWLLLIAIVASCASPPSKEIANAPANDISLSEVLLSKSDFEGEIVRWGGRIRNVEKVVTQSADKSKSKTVLQVEVLEFSLDEDGEPLTSEASAGRFIATISPPYDEEAYYRNRKITVVGSIEAYEKHELKSGVIQYFPVLNVQEKYTWHNTNEQGPNVWSRFFYSIGISNGNVGIGVIFH